MGPLGGLGAHDGAAADEPCSARLAGIPTNPLLRYTCSDSGSPGDPGAATASPYRYVDDPLGGTCHVQDGVGYEGPGAATGTWVRETVYSAGSWRIVRGPYRACLVPQGTGDRERGAIPIPQPAIRTDWDRPDASSGEQPHLITGAPVAFRMDTDTHVDKQVDFGGSTLTLALDARQILWDFGDGTTSTEASPTHVFGSKSPDAARPADHEVHVTLSVTWVATAENGNVGAEQVGTRTVTATFDRAIEEVWAARTEPSAHV